MNDIQTSDAWFALGVAEWVAGIPRLHSPGYVCVWPPKKKGAAVGGGRKTPPCKRDAGVEAAANEHANAHKYIYTPTHSGEEENISSSNLVYNKSNFITLFFMHATGYMASVWLTDEHTNTQDPHTHTGTQH